MPICGNEIALSLKTCVGARWKYSWMRFSIQSDQHKLCSEPLGSCLFQSTKVLFRLAKLDFPKHQKKTFPHGG